MNDNGERIRRVKALAGEIGRKRKDRLLASLSTLSLVLFSSLLGLIQFLEGRTSLQAKGMYASILLYENAGSYVLVAVLAFISATLLTLLGINLREKNKEDTLEKEEKFK